MNAVALLRQQLDTVNLRLHHSAADLTADELVARVLPGVNPLGFIVWHMARSQDWAINTAVRGVPELVMRPPWSATSAAIPGIGTGFELEEAAGVARRVRLDDVLAYADAVHRETHDWLEHVDERFLDTIPAVADHERRFAEYQRPAFRAEMDGGPEHDAAVGSRGGMPVWIFVTSVAITHLHRHLGEVDLVKDLLRRGVRT